MFRRLFCRRTLKSEELKTVLEMYKVKDDTTTKDDAEDDDECLYPPPPGSFTVE